jgi:hypothetical protein
MENIPTSLFNNWAAHRPISKYSTPPVITTVDTGDILDIAIFFPAPNQLHTNYDI